MRYVPAIVLCPMLVSGFGGSHFSSGWAHNNDLRPGLRWGHQLEWMVVNWILSRLGGVAIRQLPANCGRSCIELTSC